MSRFFHGALVLTVMLLQPLLTPVPPPSLEPLPLGNRDLFITPAEKAFLLASVFVPAIAAWLVRNRWRTFAYGCAAYVVIEFFVTCYLLATYRGYQGC